MKISISKLLAGMSGVMLAVAVLQGGYAISALTDIKEGLNTVSGSRVPCFIIVGQMNADFGDVRNLQAAVLQSSGEDKKKFDDLLAKAVATVDADFAKYEPLLVDEADKTFFGQVKAGWKDALGQWQKVQGLAQSGDAAGANTLFYGDAFKAYNDASDNLQKAVDDMAADTSHESDITLAKASTASLTTIVSLALASLLGVLSFIFGNVYVARPLSRITRSMNRLTKGDTSIDIPDMRRSDEIGDIAKALDVFREAAVASRQLEQDAQGMRERGEAERIASQRKAEEDAAERLKIATSGLGIGLKRLAEGDLAFQLSEPFAPDFETLRHDFNHSLEQLRHVLTSVVNGISAIETGTREIASGADDLSRRTEQQAASLEQTAAAVEQITANVGNSAKRTEDARGTAQQATSSATQSAEIVAHAEEAMQRIETSSGQIANIIGVIDEIAFQTNLLALNAGVEAARAGEAGKGFAVVAQEVRELAQRSAQAAKEIKDLIKNSSAEVQGGVKLVRDTGTALKTIGGFVVEINHHMASIAASAREQSTGLAEVNRAVSTMDQTTQQNAAMVEQSTAASATLAEEARKLRELIGRFQLNSGHRSQAAYDGSVGQPMRRMVGTRTA